MLQLINYCYEYPSFRLKLDLTISTGTRLAVCGPSGIGKTTALNLIAGLLLSSDGNITWYEKSLTAQSFRQRPIALLSQSTHVFDHLSVEDNINLGQYSLTPSQRGLFWDDLDDVIAAFELAPYKRYKVATLSGGQKQRVALVRLISQRQPLWLLDEPFNGLDDQIKATVQRILMAWQHKLQATIIFTSHHQSETQQFATDICHLHKINDIVHIRS